MERQRLDRRDGEKRGVALDGRRLVIGRAAHCDLVLDDPSVSRCHAAIETRAWTTWLLDVGSAGGTRLNGRLVSCTLLHDRDIVSVGAFELLFRQRLGASRLSPGAGLGGGAFFVKVAGPGGPGWSIGLDVARGRVDGASIEKRSFRGGFVVCAPASAGAALHNARENAFRSRT